MNKILSIIVPTYNMEKYLEKCLSSLIVDDSELLGRLEVVVVNDGSKDSSSAIAHSFEQKYPNVFKVIDKENGNYGSCINAGIPVSTGKYVKILDADDTFDTLDFSAYLRSLCSVDVDLVINNKTTVNSNGDITEKCTVDLEPNTILNFGVVSSNYQVLDMHKMAYRRTLLTDMKYRQSERVSYSDTEWTVIPFTSVEDAVYFPNYVYRYLVGRDGQTMDKTVRSGSFKSLRVVEFAIGDYKNGFHSTVQRERFISDFFIYSIIILYREFFFDGLYDADEFRAFDSELIERYPELQPIIDNQNWVSFMPNLHLAKDWRERKKLKFGIEYSLIRIYLWLRSKRDKSEK